MDHERGSSSGDEPPQKRQRVLACRRCRGRKQKCESKRPCANCLKSGDECIPTEPAPRPHVEGEYVRALEERIAELEARDPGQSQDHMPLVVNGRAQPLPSLRRLTGSSGQDAAGRPLSRTEHLTSQSDLVLAHSTTDTNSVSPANQSQARRSYSHHSPSAAALSLEDDSDSGLDHFLYGLVASPSVREDGYPLTFGMPMAPPMGFPAHLFQDGEFLPQSAIAAMSPDLEDLLLSAYHDRAQAQYPFFHWSTFLSWIAEWKACPPSELAARGWQGFFVNLVYATSLRLLAMPRVGQFEARTFYKNGLALFPHVLRRHDNIRIIQAYLILSIHSLHRSSTPRILSLASTTMRFCVQQQLHLAETEPVPTTPAIRLSNQIRRRCFWSSYCIDRLVMASYELPPSLSDAMISTKLYANIDDEDIEALAARTAVDSELPDTPLYTCVSSSLYFIQCRRIQSEIIGYTLRWDYKEHYEDSLEWRIRILNELEMYKSRVQNFSDPEAKGHTSQRWLAMIYHYTLLLLYRPTKENVLGPAGDWAIQASSQACLIFRKSQMDRQIAQAWLGLLVQFQSGVTLLYCCWATPPEYRTENYDSPDVSDALRACSNILAILTDRWPKGDCLRDVFELLAREVPLVDRPSRPPTRISDASAEAIREKLPQVRALVVQRSLMRMIEEMITQDFPRLRASQSPRQTAPRKAMPARERPSSLPASRPLPSGPSGPGPSFELPFTTQLYGGETGGGGGGVGVGVGESAPLSADELLSFPGMFDLDSWT